MSRSFASDLEVNGLSRLGGLLHSSKALNPRYFLDWLAVLINNYIGTDASMIIPAVTSNEDEKTGEKHMIHNVDQLITTLIVSDDPRYRFNVPFPIGCIRDRRYLTPDCCAPYLLDDTYQWQIAHNVKLLPPKRSGDASYKVVGAVVLGNSLGRVCVYGTLNGCFYNDANTGEPKPLLKYRIFGLWKQIDTVFVANTHAQVWTITLAENSLQPVVSAVLSVPSKKTNYSRQLEYDKFVGGYYDAKTERFYVGTTASRVLCFENDKGLNGELQSIYSQHRQERYSKILDKWNQKREFGFHKMEKASCFYFDNDLQTLTLIGYRFITRITLKGTSFDVPQLFEVEKLLPQLKFGASQILYTYELKSLFVLSKMGSSARVPWKMHVYTGKTLRFEEAYAQFQTLKNEKL